MSMNNKKSNKKIAFLLAILFVFSMILCSCDGDKENVSSEAVSGTKAGTLDAYGRPYIEDSVPDDLKFDGETVTILVRDKEPYIMEYGAEETTGSIKNDALVERNNRIEAQLGIEIKTLALSTDEGKYAPTNFNEKLRASIMAGASEFDIIASNAYYGVALSTDGLFMNLYDLPYIDLKKPWWNQTYIDEMTINDILYFAVGDASFSSINNTYATFFNKKLVEEWYPGVNLYKVTEEGKWTLDYLKQLVKDTYKDTDGTGTRSNDDFYGIGIATAATPLDALYMASNLTVTTKNAEGLPQLSMYNEKTSTFFQKVYDLITNTNGVLPGEYTEESINLMSTKFREQTAIFNITTLGATEKMTDVDFEYGILPVPKFDEAQDKYYTCNADYYSILSVPYCKDESRLPLIGATLELLAAESYRSVTPAYFEEVMKYRYLTTDEDTKMYDTVLSGIRYNFGVVNSISLADIQHLVRDVIVLNGGNFTSAYEEKANAAQAKLDDLLEFY